MAKFLVDKCWCCGADVIREIDPDLGDAEVWHPCYCTDCENRKEVTNGKAQGSIRQGLVEL